MKNIYFIIIIALSFIFAGQLTLSVTKSPAIPSWRCPGRDREFWIMKVYEYAHGDGVFETKKDLTCKGLNDRDTLNSSSNKYIGQTPKIQNASYPVFNFSSSGWSVVQNDSLTNEEIYRVEHFNSPDLTYITSPSTIGKEISFLAGEHPNILKDITIRPNPASKFIEIGFKAPISYQVKIQIANKSGDIMFSMMHPVQKDNINPLSIDVSNFNEGLYYIKFDVDDLTITKSILISR